MCRHDMHISQDVVINIDFMMLSFRLDFDKTHTFVFTFPILATKNINNNDGSLIVPYNSLFIFVFKVHFLLKCCLNSFTFKCKLKVHFLLQGFVLSRHNRIW